MFLGGVLSVRRFVRYPTYQPWVYFYRSISPHFPPPKMRKLEPTPSVFIEDDAFTRDRAFMPLRSDTMPKDAIIGKKTTAQTKGVIQDALRNA